MKNGVPDNLGDTGPSLEFLKKVRSEWGRGKGSGDGH